MAWDADDPAGASRPQFGAVLLEGALASGRTIEVEARSDAWHRIAVRVPDVKTPQQISLCIDVIRGGT